MFFVSAIWLLGQIDYYNTYLFNRDDGPLIKQEGFHYSVCSIIFFAHLYCTACKTSYDSNVAGTLEYVQSLSLKHSMEFARKSLHCSTVVSIKIDNYAFILPTFIQI